VPYVGSTSPAATFALPDGFAQGRVDGRNVAWPEVAPACRLRARCLPEAFATAYAWTSGHGVLV